MANAYHHSLSSAKKWGGKPDDYLAIHQWFDESKAHLADFRHRALRHHTQGIFECERKFGPTITVEGGKKIPTRWVGEQHVQEDCGRIPSVADWFMCIKPEPWMNKSRKLSLEHHDYARARAIGYELADTDAQTQAINDALAQRG